MITLDVHRLFIEKGITNPGPFLRQNGFTNFSSSRLLNNKYATLSFDHLEKLCIALNCTPNDLLMWTPDQTTSVSPNHPLHKLRHKQSNSIVAELKSLPSEKIDLIREYIEKIKQ